MSLSDFREKRVEQSLENILKDDSLSTYNKLLKITGDNYFTAANMAKGIYELIKHNGNEIRTNQFIADVMATKIDKLCPISFARLYAREQIAGNAPPLPNSISETVRGHIDAIVATATKTAVEANEKAPANIDDGLDR